jgi:hypothetical protein
MPELTDSYCERCGVRHVFSTGSQKGFSLRGARVLAKGLRNFVLNDGQSMGDSITTARLEDESGDSSRMTEAFHKAFNFCMTCRQYACDQCWNSQVGACLSCAPQAGSEPVAPEGHLIVRTPVARWDPDWLNFAGADTAPAAGAGASSLPAGWPGPLQIDSIRPPQAGEDLVALEPGPKAPPEPEAWPASDVLKAAPAGSGPDGKHGRAGRKAADQSAWSLWPVADELAPEMTLTPEEMMLVRAELSQPEQSVVVAAAVPAVEAEAPAVEAEAPAVEAEAPAVEAEAPAVEAEAPAVEAEAPAVEAVPPVDEPVDEPVAPEPVQFAAVQLAPEPVVPVSRAPSLPSLPEQAEPLGMVARLFGRHSSGDKPAQPGESRPVADDVVPAESWPRATPWSESPLGVGHRWTTDTVGSAETGTPDGVTAEQALDLTAPETPQEAQATPEFAPAMPEFAPTAAAVAAVEPFALEAALKPIKITAAQHREPAHHEATPPPDLEAAPPLSDARSAASIRQTAIANSADRPADETPAAGSVVQAGAPSGLEGAAEAGEDTRRKPASRGTADRRAADTKSAEPAEPVAPWPPFGASWPAQNPQSGAWPGPGNVLPAVVAAQRIRPAAEVEIWAQSSQEVMNRGTVRVCHHCALPVSTQARFCRRCGTNQA